MNPALTLRERYLRDKYPVSALLQPSGGVLSGITRLVGGHSVPDFEIAVSSLNNLTKVFGHVTMADGRDAFDEPMGGAGADVTPELAWLRAVMEGAERYANMAYRDHDFLVASANELGASAIDLDAIARCSERELSNPECPFVAPDKSAPIRWVRGYSLTNRCERFVPAVMTHLYAWPSDQERFWQEISTGVAAHVRPEAALVSAICEVIERDAIAMTWLARLQLPRIELSRPYPPSLAPSMGLLERSLVEHHFFDATTDVGIPTVYAIQVLRDHPTTAQYVNCSVEFDPAEACAKTVREAAPARAVLGNVRRIPTDTADFRSLWDGAVHLGRAEHKAEFDFLLNTPRRTTLKAMEIAAPPTEAERLKYLLARLSRLGMEVVAVDLTTDELRDLGVWVVRVVVPGLMPMSAVQRGRFLGHPRLYEYPRSAGYGAFTESDVNPTPQPFA